MLAELRVSNLGVIDEARLELTSGMTVLTGETGAGKTLLVGALTLLLGARGDPLAIRPGADEAVVQGRFYPPHGEHASEELVVVRSLPAAGRSKAEVNARMVPVASLGELVGGLVDVYGQHAHQSLLEPASERRALDAFAGIDLSELKAARERMRQLEAEMEALGGEARERARTMELLDHEVSEIERAGIADPREDERLGSELERVEQLAKEREALLEALEMLAGGEGTAVSVAGGASARSGGAMELVGEARRLLSRSAAFGAWVERLAGTEAELSDLASEVRKALEGLEEDPGREESLRARLALLRDLKRRFGDTLEEVLAYKTRASERLEHMRNAEARAKGLSKERDLLAQEVASIESEVMEKRRLAAARLGPLVQARLRELAMPRARLEVRVEGDPPGDRVVFMLAANQGLPLAPLAKAASGGELSRAMLALRLVLSGAPPTSVFDEVDAGVGGQAALSVGRSLKELSKGRQVLVVTHLPQVAAFADHHFTVEKIEERGGARSVVREVGGEERVVEIARMLAGQPGSKAARDHAEELLEMGRV